MAIYISVQRLKTPGQAQHDVQRVACSTVQELEDLAAILMRAGRKYVSFTRPNPERDSDWRPQARWTPGIMVRSSHVNELDLEAQAVKVAHPLIELLCLDLKREYIRSHHPETDEEAAYWERKEKEIAFRIYRDDCVVRSPEEFFTDEDDADMIPAINKLNRRLEKIDLGHRRRVNVRSVFSEKAKKAEEIGEDPDFVITEDKRAEMIARWRSYE